MPKPELRYRLVDNSGKEPYLETYVLPQEEERRCQMRLSEEIYRRDKRCECLEGEVKRLYAELAESYKRIDGLCRLIATKPGGLKLKKPSLK